MVSPHLVPLRSPLVRPLCLGLLVTLVSIGACHRERVGPQPSPPSESQVAPASAASAASLELEVQRMVDDITVLAADDFRGRYTLSPDLLRAAEFLVQRYTQLGLVPVGSAFTHDFSLRTGARLQAPAKVAVVRGRKTTTFTATEVTPLAQSHSGVIAGDLVFVGYAAKAEPATTDDDSGSENKPPADIYDDLAGVDLTGKIALMLLEVPGRPDPMALLAVLQADAEAFTAAAAPLRSAGDRDGLTKLHKTAQARLKTLLQPFVPESALAKLWPLPEDVLSVQYDLQELLGGLMRAVAQAPGPRFGFSAGDLKTKIKRVIDAGAVGVILVRGPRSFVSPEARDADALPALSGGDRPISDSFTVPVVQARWTAVDRLLGKRQLSRWQQEIDTTMTPRSQPVPGLRAELSVAVEPLTQPIPNVIASIPGTTRAEEIVLVGAHYDHIGEVGRGQCSEARDGEVVDKICNGADDNASGTAMVLELARALHQHPQKPERTVMFVHFAGEELGILGSKALVEAPPFDLRRVVAMINLDMVGRLGPKGLAVGGVASSPAWMPILDQVGTAGLSILYEGSVATRSDHASFYRQDIPVLFFFTGVHSDYHRPGDHSDKINREGMAAIGSIVAGVVQTVGNGHAVPWQPAGPKGGLSQGLPGSNPDTIIKRVKAGQ